MYALGIMFSKTVVTRVYNSLLQVVIFCLYPDLLEFLFMHPYLLVCVRTNVCNFCMRRSSYAGRRALVAPKTSFIASRLLL
jgi:hypothetical protein